MSVSIRTKRPAWAVTLSITTVYQRIGVGAKRNPPQSSKSGAGGLVKESSPSVCGLLAQGLEKADAFGTLSSYGEPDNDCTVVSGTAEDLHNC